MNLARFPGILSGDAVKLFLDNLHLGSIRHVGPVDGYTDGEIVFIGILQSRACRIVNGAPPLCEC